MTGVLSDADLARLAELAALTKRGVSPHTLFAAKMRQHGPALLAEVSAGRERDARVRALIERAEAQAAAMGRDITDEGYPAWVTVDDLTDAIEGDVDAN